MVDDHTAWVKGSVPPPLDQRKNLHVTSFHMLSVLKCHHYNSWLYPRSWVLSWVFQPSLTFLLPLLLDVKFDAVSGDYYPIVYFNDYWNLQKDYYPINETLKALPLRLSYCPLSLWRWQLYAAQNARSPWNFLPEDTYEQSDEDQDSVKVWQRLKTNRINFISYRAKVLILFFGSLMQVYIWVLFKLSLNNSGSYLDFYVVIHWRNNWVRFSDTLSVFHIHYLLYFCWSQFTQIKKKISKKLWSRCIFYHRN